MPGRSCLIPNNCVLRCVLCSRPGVPILNWASNLCEIAAAAGDDVDDIDMICGMYGIYGIRMNSKRSNGMNSMKRNSRKPNHSEFINTN